MNCVGTLTLVAQVNCEICVLTWFLSNSFSFFTSILKYKYRYFLREVFRHMSRDALTFSSERRIGDESSPLLILHEWTLWLL